PETRRRARNPIQYRDFMSDAATRTRYWARSAIGWPRMSTARPNAGHRALARMETAGLVQGVITQNVDRLHQAAGSRRVVELHGALGEVRCLDCEGIEAREQFQTRIATLNPGWSAQDVEIAPDGDAELAAGAAQAFQVPDCVQCEGTLKPNVVFFGENVPRERVDAAWALLDEADALLVVGSSLAVYSGYRFVLKAAKEEMPVAIVNLGSTRGDHLAQVRVDAQLGEVLPPLADALVGEDSVV
ncbi:MAG TPA: NAD-dependent protein deacetylase, partial [Rhodothermales bacterium]|nr:NAD-dependent protein deacetylase [Rhodothermales bacterium]